MAYETVHSEIIFQGRVFQVRLDDVRMPGGQVARLDIVEHRSAVAMLPLDDQGNIWFIRQYRHPAAIELLELPAGVMDEGEIPEVSAQRELREEIGMSAKRLEELGSFFLAPGYSNEYMYVYLAQDLSPAPLQPDADEFIEIVKVPVADVGALIGSRKIRDAKTLATLCLWMNR